MMIQTDTIFVSGLPVDVEPPKIAEFFGQIGIIKVFFITIVCTNYSLK